MHRLLILLLLFVSAGLNGPAAAQTSPAEGLPPRPTPFRFVNDQAQLMAPADVKKLESGLRRYADTNGTQIVVVTVPNLGGREVADYGRALGTAWGIGQRDKNNGLVVLLSAQDHKLTIQPGSGLQDRITPEVTNRAIAKMTPGFKQGNYFGGLRQGLNTLMLAANPGSAPETTTTPAAAPAGAAAGAGATGANLDGQAKAPVSPTPNDPLLTPPTSQPDSGPGMGTVLLGALVVGGIIWLLVRMLRGRSQAGAPTSSAPDFLPNRNPGGSNNPGNVQRGGSNFGGGGMNSGGGGNFGGGGMGGSGMGGSGMGGILATGAAAAAGAYLGNRMASGHEAPGQGLTGDGTTPQHFDPNTAAGAAGAGAVGTGAADDYFSSRDGDTANAAPDYFSDDNSADNSSKDFFSSDDNSSYDDPSSGDSGGGDFDSGNDNSGSW